MSFLHLLILLLEEVVAGDCQGGHQHHKLVEIHLIVLVGIQVVHDFLHQHRILLGLQTKRDNKRTSCRRCRHGGSSVGMG